MIRPMKAPAPAPSVGVKTPNQMPPSTAATTRKMPPPLPQACSRVLSGSSSMTPTCAAPTVDMARAGAGAAPTISGRTMATTSAVEAIEAGDHQAGDHAGEENLADRFLGEDAPHDHQHARRDQHAEAGGAGDGAEREAAIVAMALHLRIGNARERRGAGDAHAGDEGKQRVAEHGGDRQPSGNVAQAAIDALVDVGDRAGAADEFAHQHEQRNDREHIVAQRLHRRSSRACW